MTAPEGAALPALLAGYRPGPLDEAVDPGGQVRPGYADIVATLDKIGIDGVRAATRRLDSIRKAEGITFIAEVDGELQEQPFPLDPIPRLLSAEDWIGIGAGLRQRTRALNAFLSDVYGDANIVRDGVIPESVIRNCPGFLPAARDLARRERGCGTVAAAAPRSARTTRRCAIWA